MSEDAEESGTGLLSGVNTGRVVYGVLSVGTVIAAESTKRETYFKLFAASVLTMVLYWLAHAYSFHLGGRLQRVSDWSPAEVARVLAHEAWILVGAIVPIGVLVVAWISGVSKETAVTSVLWCVAVELVLLEVAAGIRLDLRLRDLVIQAAMGATMGLGLLALRIVLH